MGFVNQFKKYKKDSKNIYNDFEIAWAEYEYICQMIKTKITELIKVDNEYWQQHGFDDDFYINVDIDDQANIIITIKPVISISVIQKISELLGVDGKISIVSSKKNAKIRISFNNKQKINYEEDKDLIID